LAIFARLRNFFCRSGPAVNVELVVFDCPERDQSAADPPL
jgi:hypothetical protein